MTDNAKCAGVGCPIRETCDRFTRPAVDGQRWVEPLWEPWPNAEGFEERCMDRIPISVQPHGGAREEVDGS